MAVKQPVSSEQDEQLEWILNAILGPTSVQSMTTV